MKKKIKKKINRMIGVSPYLSIAKFKINSTNSPIKQYRLYKHCLLIRCLRDSCLIHKDAHSLETNGGYQALIDRTLKVLL